MITGRSEVAALGAREVSRTVTHCRAPSLSHTFLLTLMLLSVTVPRPYCIVRRALTLDVLSISPSTFRASDVFMLMAVSRMA